MKQIAALTVFTLLSSSSVFAEDLVRPGSYVMGDNMGTLRILNRGNDKTEFYIEAHNPENHSACYVHDEIRNNRAYTAGRSGARRCVVNFHPIDNSIIVEYADTHEQCSWACGDKGHFEGEYRRRPQNGRAEAEPLVDQTPTASIPTTAKALASAPAAGVAATAVKTRVAVPKQVPAQESQPTSRGPVSLLTPAALGTAPTPHVQNTPAQNTPPILPQTAMALPAAGKPSAPTSSSATPSAATSPVPRNVAPAKLQPASTSAVRASQARAPQEAPAPVTAPVVPYAPGVLVNTPPTFVIGH